MRKYRFLFFPLLFLLSFLISPPETHAVRPIEQYNDLVAGSGEEGFRDGSFVEARFNRPTGLALDATSETLYVADTQNHRIRAIHLDQRNLVSTVAGSGQAGKLDGPALKAELNSPRAIAVIPGDRLLIADNGNGILRVLDLKRGVLSTLPAVPKKGSPGLPLGAYSMGYDAKGEFVYLSITNDRRLLKLDLKDNAYHEVLVSDPRVPFPLALSNTQGQWYLADRDLPDVYRLPTLPPYREGPLPPVGLEKVAQGDHVLSLCAAGNFLYSFQDAKTPWLRLLPQPSLPMSLMSVWGPTFEPGSDELSRFLSFEWPDIPGVVEDPRELRKFFVALPRANIVVALRDLGMETHRKTETRNANALTDFSYTTVKPPHTYRLLLVGDSRLSYTQEKDRTAQKWGFDGFNRMETFPKKLELLLNTRGAVQNVPTRYQCLSMFEARHAPLFLWPLSWVPKVLKPHDVDAVLFFVYPDDMNFRVYFDRPLDANNIPIDHDDPEFMLKTLDEKLPSWPPFLQDMVKRMREKKWVSENPLSFAAMYNLISDEAIRRDMLEMFSVPLSKWVRDVKATRTLEGKPVQFHIVFTPLGSMGSPTNPYSGYREFWKLLASRLSVPFIDLTDEFIALRTTYYPTEESQGFMHFDWGGHLLLSGLYADKFIEEGVVPFKPSK